VKGLFLPFAKGGFATASGKAELYSEKLAPREWTPVVSFIPQRNLVTQEGKAFPAGMLRGKLTTS